METKDVFTYYIDYEMKVALASETMKNLNKYMVSRRNLNHMEEVKEIFERLKKDDIVTFIKKGISKHSESEFSDLISKHPSMEIDDEMILDFIKKHSKKSDSIIDEIMRKKEANHVHVLCPFYDETPMYILACEIDTQIRVHHITVSETTLMKLLSKALCIYQVDVLSDYGEELMKFKSFLRNIHYQLDIKELIHLCNHELEQIFNIKILKGFSDHAAFVQDYSTGNYRGIKDDLLAMRPLLKDIEKLSKPFRNYLEIPKKSDELSAYKDEYYYGSYKSAYPVNQTQFQIVNGMEHHFLMAVEGPPGTGKSSLLKEMIANAFVKRTYHLVEDWHQKWKKEEDIYEIPFHEDVINSILITSKNGEAIDNIDSEINKEIEYFCDIAKDMNIMKQEVLLEPNFTGIFCAKLGNKDNKTTFFDFFDHTFLKHLHEYDMEASVEELLHDFREQYDHLTRIYEDLTSIDIVYGKDDFVSSKILSTKQKVSSQAQDIHEQLHRDHIQKEDITKRLTSTKALYEEETYRIHRVNARIEEIEERISRTEDACLLYKQYEGVSKLKKLFDPAVRSFLKKYTIFDLVNEIGDFKLKLKDERHEKDEIEKKIKETYELLQQIQKEDASITSTIQHHEQQQSEIQILLRCVEVCENLNMEMKDDIARYDNFHEVFSNAYLFKKRQELFTLSLQLNEAYIFEHKNEILANLNMFWDGTFICRQFYQPGGEYTQKKATSIRRLWNTFQLCFPVVTSTLDSCVMNNFPLLPGLFDFVMVDEAGQVLPHCLLPALYRSKKALIVGDVAQLEPIENIHNSSLLDLYEDEDRNVLQHLDIEKRSIQMQANESSEVLDQGHPIVLNDHYRCEENIVAFSKKYVYPKLQCHVKNSFDKPFGNNLIHFDVRGMKALNKHSNTSEVHAVIAAIQKIREFEGKKDCTIGVITPFKDQRDEIKSLLKKHKLQDISVGTIHTYQGKQMDYIIMSTVIDDLMDASKLRNLYKFIGDKPNMLNVALTRAKKQFILIGNYDGIKKSNNYLQKVLTMIEEKGTIFSMYLEPIETYTNHYEQIILDVLNAKKQLDHTSILGRYLETTLPHGLIEDPKLHYEIFKFGLSNVKDSFFVCSPWIRQSVLNDENLTLMEHKMKDKIRIEMTIGYKKLTKKATEESIIASVSPYQNHKETEALLQDIMKRFGDKVHITPPLHTKFLILDDKYMFIGSHNWLSNSGKTDTKELSTLVSDVDAIEYVKKKYLALKDITKERLAPIR